MKIPLIPLVVLLALGGTALADDGDAPKKDADKFKITTKSAKTTPWRSSPTRTRRCST